MALVLADRVLETTTTAGSGTITLAGAEPGYQSFSAVGDGNQTYYTIAGDTEWEVGIGTYTASGTMLSRDTVLSSSNSGAKVTFSAGVKKVFVTYPSEKSVNRDVSGNISASSGVITNVATPSAASDAATKLYVDSLVAAGITYHSPVKYEVPNTTGNLNATYNNGTAGVSATLTNAGTLAAFVPDGVTATISDRVLVYNQTNAYENGVYTVTVVGDGSTAWVLTRASDADTYALKSPNSLGEGDAFFVTSGDTGAGETYLCNTTGTIVFGSTAISFVQISSAQVYKAGTGISLTNTTISLVSPVAVATGGTGTTGTPTNGQLLIGNGSGYTLSTLTAGSGVSITNSAGSITLSATGLGGTVTAVTATGPLASSGGTTPDISIANSTGTGSVVLDQGATISSATITAALSASITTITGSSANITTVSGTTARFSSAAITQLSGTSAGITTVSGTTTTFSSGTITQFGATSATITTLSGTSVSYPNASFTSATVTNLSSTSANITTLTGTSATLTGGITAAALTATQATAFTALSIVRTGASPSTGNVFNSGNLLTFSYNGTAITFNTGGTPTEQVRITSAGNVGIGTASPGQKLEVNGAIQLPSGNPIYFFNTNYFVRASTGLELQSGDLIRFLTNGANERMRIDSSGNVGIGTTSPGAKLEVNGTLNTYGSTTVVGSGGARVILDTAGDIYAYRAGGTTGVIFLGSSGTRYLYYDGTNYQMPNGQLYVNGVQAVTNSGTWGISITGNAATATSTSGATNCTFSADAVNRANITTRVDSGFYEHDTPTTAEGWPVNGSWMHMIACTHSNDANYYSMQLAGDFFSNTYYMRSTNGNGATGWSTLITSSNISSFAAGLPTVNVTSSTAISAVAGNHYILRGGATTVTLPASPAAGAVVWVTVSNGRTDNVIARNGQNIQGLAENMTLNSKYAAVQLRFSDATMGWIFC